MIGEAVRKIRKEKKVSVKELADELKISSSHLYQIERGFRSPSITLLENISDKLEIPLAVALWMNITEYQVSINKRELFKTFKPVMDEIMRKIFI